MTNTPTTPRQQLIAATGQPEEAPATIGALASMLATLWQHLETTSSAEENRLVSVNELANHYRCGTTRIATAIAAARVEGVRVGPATRYPRAATLRAIAPHLSAPLPV